MRRCLHARARSGEIVAGIGITRHAVEKRGVLSDPRYGVTDRGAAGPGLCGTSRHWGGQGGAPVPAHEARWGRAGAAAPGPQDPLAAGQKYCAAAGIDPSRLGSRGIGIHSLRKTAINDVIRNGATMHEVQEFAGHTDIRTTEVYFMRSAQRKRAC